MIAFLALWWPEIVTVYLALLIAGLCLYWFDRDLVSCLVIGVPTSAAVGGLVSAVANRKRPR